MRTHFFLGSTMAPTSSTPRSAGTKRVGSTTPATRTAKRSRKRMVPSLSTPYATSARAKNCLTIINSKWTNRSRARSKLRMHVIVAAQIAAAPCLIQAVNVLVYTNFQAGARAELSRADLGWWPTGIAGKIEEGLFREDDAIDAEFKDRRHSAAAR